MNWQGIGDAVQTSVRPIVTILLTAVLCWGFIIDKIGGEAFLGVVGMTLAWWFRDREAEKEREATKAAAVIAENKNK